MQPGDEDLVALARNGDHKAFEELVERHKQKAYRIAFDFARDREEAKDLSQEAFLRAYTHLGNFDGRSGFYTWFYRILVNVCLDYKRVFLLSLVEDCVQIRKFPLFPICFLVSCANGVSFPSPNKKNH